MTPPKLVFLSVFALILVEYSVLSDEGINLSSEGKGVTYVEIEHIKYDWTIENFSFLPQKNNEDIRSPVFCGHNNETQWRIQLYPQGDKSVGYVALYLRLHSYRYSKVNVTAYWEMSILKGGTVHHIRTHQRTFDELIGWGYSEDMERSKLIRIAKPDDTFTIRVEIKLPKQVITKPYKVMDPLEEELTRDLESHRLNQHFHQLFKEPKFSDLVVIASNESFNAHKVILGIRSSVFAAHFEAEKLVGNETNQLIIEDFEPILVNAMLEFLYTDQVTDLETQAYGLLEAADKFELPRLKTMCELVLYRALNENNAADLLILTDLYHANKLKEHIVKFIGHHISAVMNSGGYARLEAEYPRLALELFRAITDKSSDM
ncbi:speckle-type POZ protein B [Fopius arisanus]|uniref:Speckle-type POZ protein B n=1 Tax=Fopius arisanus TaxID=64838 RepID=A0A9R1U3A4_9HYME|nr:PREDICTED: speckle-type POZ protein B-like [Fopius arisanus]XP_011305532.1 PREDICTED: speckle-type POZ protein B-like [Fopius arisanus]